MLRDGLVTAAEVDRRRVTRRILWGTWVIALFIVNPLCAGFEVRWYWIFAIELAMVALAGLADVLLRRPAAGARGPISSLIARSPCKPPKVTV